MYQNKKILIFNDLIIVLIFFACFSHAYASDLKTINRYISTFDNDQESWRLANDVTLSWESSGGNSGGFLKGSDIGTGECWYFVSPESWAGDWSMIDRLSYDFKLIETGEGGEIVNNIDLIIIGVNDNKMNYSFQSSDYPNNTWKTYSIEISHSIFNVKEDEFYDIIKNVKELWIRGEYTNKYDIEGIDNVILIEKNTSCEINDLDSDGVIDQWDKCVQTSENSATYSNGCIAQDLYSEIELLKQQIESKDQIIDQKEQLINDQNTTISEKNKEISEFISKMDSMYSEEEMESMIQNILTWGDFDNDGKIGLKEAIKALMVTAGFNKGDK